MALDTLATVALAGGGAVWGAVAGLAVPALLARVPEPTPEPVDVTTERTSTDESGAVLSHQGHLRAPQDSGPGAGDTEQPTFGSVARARWLPWQAALVGAVSAGAASAALGADWRLLPWLLALPLALALGFVDWHTKLLPNRLMWPLLGLLTCAVPLAVWVETGAAAVGWALVGAAATWVFYFVLWFVHPSGLGFGDVRLSWAVGLLLGAQGWGEVLAGVWLGFVLGGVGGLLLGGLRGARTRRVPFGPFMLLGALAGLLVGGHLGLAA